ncbi:pro-neuregulin-1, membrane-bound isoform-like [Acropora palmata]|uniref:pro-neuregulin-1, membrane-bound isoform-like n=1 Tax=Acropora palmata TaxID=6131 RepID=UPI003DA1241C
MKTALVLFVLVGIVCAVKEKGKGESSKQKSGSLDATSSSHREECKTQSQRDHYCLNGGTCFRVPALGDSPHCHCTAEFTGKRCEQRVPQLVTRS